MADKDIKINIVTETDLSKLDELDERLSALEEKAGIKVESDVDISGVESLQSALDEANAKVEELEDALSEAELNGDDIEADIIADQLAEARDEAESLQEALDNLDSSTVSPEVDDSSIDNAKEKTEELEAELDNVDNKTVTPDVDTSNIDNAKENLNGTASSMDNITTAAAGLAATAGIEQMVTTADNINTSWNRLELTFSGTGVSMDTLKTKASALSESTGRSGGVVRDYFNQMGIAGVTNTDLLSSSFEALAGKAYQTNSSVEAMEGKMQTMVLTGNASSKMLKSLGLSAEDLANAMGVSADQVSDAFKDMTPEQRLEAISKAMGDGAEANKMYKDSYAGLKDQAQTAMAGLMGAVGQAILPVLVPALQMATDFIKKLTDGFKNLPGPVQAIIGGIGGFAAILAAGAGVLGIFGTIIGTVKTGLATLRSITLLSRAATLVATAAQWLWNAALSANPIGLVVIAIIALIAILGYLYFNNEQVREAINNLGQKLMWIAGVIWDTIGAAIQWLSDQFNAFTEQLGLNSGSWTDAVLGFIAFIPTLPLRVGQVLLDTIASALGFGENFTQSMIDAATNAVNGFIEQVMQLPGLIMTTLQGIWDYVLTLGGLIPEQTSITGNMIIDTILNVLMFFANIPAAIAIYLTDSLASALGFGSNFAQTMLTSAMNAVTGFVTWLVMLPVRGTMVFANMISQVIGFGSNFVSNMISAGSRSVSNFIGYISQIPGKLATELGNALNKVGEWAATLPQKFWEAGVNAVKNFLSALGINSPGIMQRTLVWEVSEMGRRVPEEGKGLIRNVNQLGSDVVDAFGSPELGMSFGNNSVVGNGAGQVNNFYFSDITVDDDKRMQKIVDAVAREINFNNVTAGRTV